MSENSRDRETSGLKGSRVQGADRTATGADAYDNFARVIVTNESAMRAAEAALDSLMGDFEDRVPVIRLAGRDYAEMTAVVEAIVRALPTAIGIAVGVVLREFQQRQLHPSRDGSSDSAEPLTTESSPNQKHPNKRAAPLHRDGA